MAKILFLAQFAPTNGEFIQTSTPEEEFYAQTYHIPIYNFLVNNNYDFVSSNDVNELITNHDKYDLVWSVYNRLGFRNSEVFVQSLCEYYGITYIGAAPNIRALIEDKSMSKQLAEHINVPTAKWVVASPKYPLCKVAPFPGPYFVKPRFGSASLGIDESCLCENWENVLDKANEFFSLNTEIIVEEYINGVYYGVPIMNSYKDEEPIVAIPHFQTSTKKGHIITNAQKRFTDGGMSRFISENESLNRVLIYFAKSYFKEAQPCDYARIDFIVVESTGIPYFLELNALMNLGQRGGFVASFLKSGFNSYEEIIKHILDLGLSKLT